MKIIFPMAGQSSRFFKAGYTQPKYMLDLAGKSLFSRVIGGFEFYFEKAEFLFIYRDLQDTGHFISAECAKLGLKNHQSIELEKETLGQAHTVMLGLEEAKMGADEELLIFNIDTIRPDFRLPQNLDRVDGYLEVFEGEGEQWSFVLPSEEGSCRVIKTSEKERISHLCSTGLYYFKRASDFMSVFRKMWAQKRLSKGEFFIAPMYNELILQGGVVVYEPIAREAVLFCGTPLEYEDLKGRI